MTTKQAHQPIAGNAREPRWPMTAWMSRMFMVPPTLILALITLRFITDPAHALARTGVVLSQPEAVTDTRVIGAITMTLVALLLSAIFSRTRLRRGHAVVILVMGLVLVVRLYGFAVDGTTLATGDQLVKTRGEVIFLLLNAVGFVVQTLRLNPGTPPTR